MDWIRENKVLASISGVSLAGIAGLAVVLVMTYMGYSDTLASFDALNGSIARLKSERLAPTPENLAAKQAVVQEYQQAVDKLSFVLHSLQQQDKPISETEFQARLKSKISEIREQAGQLGVGLPAEFNLGFDQYTSSLPRSAAVASQLSGYLGAVNEVTRMFISSGIRSLDSFERSEIETEKDAPAPKPAPRPTVRPGAPRPAAAPQVPSLVDRRKLTATVTTDQIGLQNLVNKLASPSEMPFFTVLRLLRIENERQEGPVKAEMVLPQPDAAPETTPDGAPATLDPNKPAPRDSLAVLGQERLRVYLEVDLVTFLETPKQPAPSR